MKKILMVLMVFISLVSFGDQFFKKGTHTKWFNNFNNNSNYNAKASECLYTQVASFYNKNQKVSLIRYISEIIRARDIVENSITFDLDLAVVSYRLDSYENNFDCKVLDDEIIVFEIKKDFGYAGYINMKTKKIYLYPYKVFNYDINRTDDKEISEVIDEINEGIRELPELKNNVFSPSAVSQFKRSNSNEGSGSEYENTTKRKPKRLGYDN